MLKIFNISTIFAILLFANSVFSAEKPIEENASKFVNAFIEQAFTVLDERTKLTQKEYLDRMGSILSKNFAINYIAGAVLGQNISKLDDADKKEYQSLFREYTLLTYSYLLAGYSRQNFQTISVAEQSTGEVLVATKVEMSEQNTITIDWRVKQIPNSDNFLVIDVIVLGVSLVQTKRSEFDSVIASNKGDVKKLLNIIKKSIKKLEAEKLPGMKK